MAVSEFLNNSTQVFEDEEPQSETVVVCLYFCAVLVSTGNIVFGLVSWITIRKWRQFRHYVFLCLLLTNVPDLAIYLILDTQTVLVEFIIAYSRMTFTHWLMIITAMFYIEFVKVFRSLETINHIFLHANVFGWLVPLVTLLIAVYGGEETVRYITFVLLFINFVLYLNVLYTLCRPVKVVEGQGVGKKIILSTFAFTVTGFFIWVPLVVLTVLDKDIFIAILWPYVITVLFINVFFLILKSHRELWAEYWLRAKNNKM